MLRGFTPSCGLRTGFNVGRKRVERLMAEASISGGGSVFPRLRLSVVESVHELSVDSQRGRHVVLSQLGDRRVHRFQMAPDGRILVAVKRPGAHCRTGPG